MFLMFDVKIFEEGNFNTDKLINIKTRFLVI